MLEQDRRVKVFFIDEREMIALLTAHLRDDSLMALPRWDLPEGFQFRCIFHDPTRCGFGVMVWHESFDELPIGSYAENIETRYVLVKYNKVKEGSDQVTVYEETSETYSALKEFLGG